MLNTIGPHPGRMCGAKQSHHRCGGQGRHMHGPGIQADIQAGSLNQGNSLGKTELTSCNNGSCIHLSYNGFDIGSILPTTGKDHHCSLGKKAIRKFCPLLRRPELSLPTGSRIGIDNRLFISYCFIQQKGADRLLIRTTTTEMKIFVSCNAFQMVCKEKILIKSVFHMPGNSDQLLLKKGIQLSGIPKSYAHTSWIRSPEQTTAKRSVQIKNKIIGMMLQCVTEHLQGCQGFFQGLQIGKTAGPGIACGRDMNRINCINCLITFQ